MANVTNITVEILEGNCGGATEDEIDRYALAVEERLLELYPSAEVTTEIVYGAGGSGRAPRVVGGSGEDQDTVSRVVQDVWEAGEFWAAELMSPGARQEP